MSILITELIDKQIETANLDYKEGFEWTKDNRDKRFELIKDILGMANTRDGGTILLGVKDDTRELVGVSRAIWDSFDQSAVAEMVHQKSTPKVNLQVIKTEVRGKLVVAVTITEFEDVPIICTDTISTVQNTSRVILRKGAVYIRTSGASTEEISSDQDMRELLSRAMLKRGDELLRSVERLIKGKPLHPNEESVNLYSDEAKQAEVWFKDVLQKGFQISPRWELRAHPSQYLPERIPELPDIERVIKESQVSLRGWPFPYLEKNQSAFNTGLQGYVDDPDIREGFRLYKSGQFIFKRALWEDLKGYKTPKGKTTLSFINTIYNITEWLLFLARLHEAIGTTDSVRLQVRLIGSKGRQLTSFDARVHLFEWFESQEDIISFQRDYTVEELRTSPKEIAVTIVKHIFHVFNVKGNEVRDDDLENWQTKLLNRTY